MEKSWKRAIPVRKYRERSQPQKRAKLGLLEKKKDYKERAKNYHAKENALSNKIFVSFFLDKLREKAAAKNPDEFYMKMTKVKMVDGKLTVLDTKRDAKDISADQAKNIALLGLKQRVEASVCLIYYDFFHREPKR